MAELGTLEAMADDAESFYPTEGYNVVGVDDFELPGEQLYLIGHFASESEANTKLKAWKAENPDETAYVYGPRSAAD